MARPASEEHKQQWRDRISNQHHSGLSIATWCHQNKIAVYSFYYWQKKLFPAVSANDLMFSEIVDQEKTSNSGITLEYQGVNIHLANCFTPSTLKRCLEVLKGC